MHGLIVSYNSTGIWDLRLPPKHFNTTPSDPGRCRRRFWVCWMVSVVLLHVPDGACSASVYAGSQFAKIAFEAMVQIA